MMKWRIFTQLIVILLLLPIAAQAGSIIPSVTKCSVEGTELDSGGYHYVCSKNSKNLLAWMPARRNPGGGSMVIGTKNSAANKIQNSAANKNNSLNPTIIIQTEPKIAPTLIPNTSIPWPNPIGNIDAYPGIESTQHANDLFGLKDLHKQGITGAGYSVAFIDSPMIPSHPAFASTSAICVTEINPEADQVTNCPTSVSGFSHGQGVAGTIGGIFGVAPGSRLISIQGSMVSGLNWIAENYKKYNIVAVSLSIGEGGGRDNLVCGVASPLGFKEVLTKLSNEDVAVLFSTANQGTVNWVREPNCMPGVIAVASVNSGAPQTIAKYSSISPDVDILAPADFYSAGSNNDEVMFGGTSQATPFAAAIFALGKQARPDANIAQIFYFMKLTSAPVDDVFVKRIPVVRPVEMVKALKDAKNLPLINLVKQIQVKSGS